MFTKPFPHALKTTRLTLLIRWIHIFRSLANLLAEESYLKAACERPIRKRATKITENCMIVNQARGLKEIWNRYKCLTMWQVTILSRDMDTSFKITQQQRERLRTKFPCRFGARLKNQLFFFLSSKKLNLKIKTDKSQKNMQRIWVY